MWYNTRHKKSNCSRIAKNRLVSVLSYDRVYGNTRSPTPVDYVRVHLEELQPVSLLSKFENVYPSSYEGRTIKWRKTVPFTIGENE